MSSAILAEDFVRELTVLRDANPPPADVKKAEKRYYESYIDFDWDRAKEAEGANLMFVTIYVNHNGKRRKLEIGIRNEILNRSVWPIDKGGKPVPYPTADLRFAKVNPDGEESMAYKAAELMEEILTIELAIMCRSGYINIGSEIPEDKDPKIIISNPSRNWNVVTCYMEGKKPVKIDNPSTKIGLNLFSTDKKKEKTMKAGIYTKMTERVPGNPVRHITYGDGSLPHITNENVNEFLPRNTIIRGTSYEIIFMVHPAGYKLRYSVKRVIFERNIVNEDDEIAALTGEVIDKRVIKDSGSDDGRLSDSPPLPIPPKVAKSDGAPSHLRDEDDDNGEQGPDNFFGDNDPDC